MSEDYFITEPMIEGETVERRYSRFYAEARKTRQPVDFAIAAEMRAELKKVPQDYFAITATLHLNDALNEELPTDIRETHFDIAGSLIWQAISYSRQVPDRLIYLFQQGNGI